MQIVYVDTIEKLRPVITDVCSAGVVGWDLETSGLSALTDRIRTMQFSTHPDLAYVVGVQKLNDPGLYTFFTDILAEPTRVVVAQNGKFDLSFFTRFMNQGPLPNESFYDTMIVSKLLSFDRFYEIKQDRPHWVEYNRHSLGEIVLRELGITLDKSLQKSDFSGPLSQEQIEYAGRDAAILLSVREEQIKRLKEHSLERVARLECDFVPCMADLELNGFYLDSEAWNIRTERQAGAAEVLKNQFLKLITPHAQVIDLWGEAVINIDSPAQLVHTLRGAGIPINSTKEEELLFLAPKYPEARLLLDYKEQSTALKKFGPDYLKFISPVTGRIHADFQQITAPSGRGSCWRPNLQQVPQDSEYRTAFKAQNGGKIVGADFSQIELRIMAKFSGDPQLTKVFMEGASLHKHTCHHVLGEPLENQDPVKYRISKNLNFGATYGAGGERFAQVAGISVEEAESVLKRFWKVYTVLDSYQRVQGEKCARGDAKTFSGRKVKLNFDPEDRRAYSSAVRLGRNFGIQGSGADILKRACYLMRGKAIQEGLDCRLVNQIHDEIVAETNDDSEKVARLVELAMIEAGQEVLGEIPCTVEVKIGDTWTK